MESLIFQYIWPACYEKDYDKQQGQIVTMIKVLMVCHGRIDVSVDKLCNSTISHDTV